MSMWASTATEGAVRELRQRVDLRERHVSTWDEQPRQLRGMGVRRFSSEPVIPIEPPVLGPEVHVRQDS